MYGRGVPPEQTHHLLDRPKLVHGARVPRLQGRMEAHSNNIRTPENDSRINVCELSQRGARRAAVGSSFVSLAKRRVSIPIARSLRGGAHYSIENPLYRYLIAISKLRLGILTEQGEGS